MREHLDTTGLSYGRPGLGGSDPFPPGRAVRPVTLARMAEHLLDVVTAAGLAPPYVLVGGAIGGWITDRFAARRPAEVAGLVQLDPALPRPIPGMEPKDVVVDGERGRGFLLDWPSVFPELRADPPPTPRRAVVVSRADGTTPEWAITGYWKPLTRDQLDRGWRECQREWARRLGAVHVVARTAGHQVMVDQPELVAHVVGAVVDAARADAAVVLDPAALARAGGELLGPPAAVGV